MFRTNDRRTLARNAYRRRLFRPMVRTLEERVTPTVFTVLNNADAGVGSLRQAIMDTNATSGSDVILFSLPAGPQTISLQTALPVISDGVSIRGPGAGLLTIRRDPAAATQFGIFSVNDGDFTNLTTVYFEDITISGGRSAGNGAAINVVGDALALGDMVFQDNSAFGHGGAVDITQGILTVNHCTFAFNIAGGSGGAIAVHSGLGNYLIGSTFVANFAGSSGGGGAVAFLGTSGTVWITRCTITENVAAGLNGGGGLYCDSPDTIMLSDTIVSGNTGEFGFPDDVLTPGKVSARGLAIGLITGIATYHDQGDNLVGADLKLGSFGYHGSSAPVIPLGPGSKAIDAGITVGNGFDQRGFPRPAGKAFDIGAYEAQEPTVPLFNVVFPSVTTSGAAVYPFPITYQDKDFDVGSLDVSSLDDNDVYVTGPNGFNVPGHFVKSTTVGILTTATYEFTPPGGSWDGADNGTYTVYPNLDQVFDTTGFAVKPPITLGTFQVDTNYIVTNVNDGPVTKAGDLPGSLRQAIFDSNAFAGADTILFDSTMFNVAQTIGITAGVMSISGSLTIDGPVAGKLTLDAKSKSAVLTAQSQQSVIVLNHLTITAAGSSTASAIAVVVNSLTMNDCVIAGNKIRGLYCEGSLTLTDCVIANNAVASGTAGVLANGNTVIIRCTFADNVTTSQNGSAGGLNFVGESLTLDSCTFVNNATTQMGGGLRISPFNSTPSVVIRNCTFSGNKANAGAAIGVEANVEALLIQNSTIANNVANTAGGGIGEVWTSSAVLTLESTIVSGNKATAEPTFANFIVNGLSAKSCGLADTTGIANFLNQGGNVIGGDFNLSPLGNYGGTTQTFALAEGSALIDNGSNPANLTTDQRGFERNKGAGIDIGAFEAVRPTANPGTFANIAAPGGTTYSLTVTYNDDDGTILVGSLDGNDLRITGPDGFDVLATFKSVDNNTNGKTRVAQYEFTPPGGTWTAIDKGTYTVSIETGQILDTTALGVAAGVLGSFQVTIPDITSPTALLTFSDIPIMGATLHTLQVTYSDDVRVKVSTIDGLDIRVKGGPSGFNVSATLQGVDVNIDGSPRLATYTFAAPGGQWDGFDLGTYTVNIEGSQVMDTAGLAVNAVTLGTFTFDLLNTVVWDGGPTGNGTDWHIASNWNHDKLPVSTDDVFINTAKTVALNASATIKSLNCATSLTQIGGTLTISAASYVNGAWVLDSNCILSGAGDLTLSGNSTWSGGNIIGSGKLRIAAGATLAITTNGFRQYARQVENSGTVVWSGANGVDTGAGASWTNLAGSSFDAQANNQMWGGNFTPFTNQPNSTFKRSTGSGTVVFGEAFNHQAGPITISSGILQLVAGGIWPNDVTFTGNLHLTRGTFALQKVSGDRLTVANTNDPGATVTASLEVTELNQTGSTLNISGTSSAGKWTMSGGLLDGAGDLTVAGASTWSSGLLTGTGKLLIAGKLAMTTINPLQYARPIENSGEVVWTGPQVVNSFAGGSWTNRAGSSFDAQADQDWGNFAAPFTNQPGSTFKCSAGTGSARFSEAFHHQSGPIEISSGFLQLNGGGTWPNYVTFTGDLRLLHGTFSLQKLSGDRLTVGEFFGNLVSVTGSLQVAELIHDNGTLNINATSTVGKWTMTAGIFDGTGDFSVTGQATWSGGTQKGSGTTIISKNVNLHINTASIHVALESRTWSNHGMVTWTGGNAIIAGYGGSWTNNSGSNFDVQSPSGGAYYSSGALTSFIVGVGATFKKSVAAGTTLFQMPFTNHGTVQIDTGTLHLSVGLTNYTGSTLAGGSFFVSGTLQYSGGDVITNAASITLDGPAASIQKSDGSNALSNLATNTMAGHLTLQSGGSLTVINTFINHGLVVIGIGSQIATAAGDYVQAAGETTVAGTLDPFGSFLLQGGTLNSTGTVLAPIVNSGGTVSPGNSPGILTVNGDYVQSGTGTLNIELNGLTPGSQHDQLAVNGIVTLGGSLLVTLGYTPQVGDSFIAVSNDGTDTISGTFTGLSEGAFINLPTGRLQITYQGGSDNNDVVLTAVPPLVVPAKVSSTTINDGSAQRSRVTSIQVAFDTLVTFVGSPASAFALNRQPDNALVVLNAAVNNTGPGTLVTLTFIGGAVEFGSLADGRYTLTALADQFTSGLDGDGNGVAGDNYVLASSVAPNPPTNIFRLFGDANGDGTVAANDFIQFRLALGGNNPIFDFDGDGAVAASDFIQFRLRFGGSI